MSDNNRECSVCHRRLGSMPKFVDPNKKVTVWICPDCLSPSTLKDVQNERFDVQRKK